MKNNFDEHHTEIYSVLKQKFDKFAEQQIAIALKVIQVCNLSIFSETNILYFEDTCKIMFFIHYLLKAWTWVSPPTESFQPHHETYRRTESFASKIGKSEAGGTPAASPGNVTVIKFLILLVIKEFSYSISDTVTYMIVSQCLPYHDVVYLILSEQYTLTAVK